MARLSRERHSLIALSSWNNFIGHQSTILWTRVSQLLKIEEKCKVNIIFIHWKLLWFDPWIFLSALKFSEKNPFIFYLYWSFVLYFTKNGCHSFKHLNQSARWFALCRKFLINLIISRLPCSPLFLVPLFPSFLNWSLPNKLSMIE